MDQPPMNADERRYFIDDDPVSGGFHLRLSAFICGSLNLFLR
jgi:hypothetical protein